MIEGVLNLGKYMAVFEKLANSLHALVSSTDIMDKWKSKGVLPFKFTVFDYEITTVIEDRRQHSIEVTATISDGAETVDEVTL